MIDKDVYTEMLEISMRLAERDPLTPAETIISDVMWLGTQAFFDGLIGWIANTSCERLEGTLSALAETGSPEVLHVVRAALATACIDPGSVSDSERERRVYSLSDPQVEQLHALDSRFHDVFEPSLELLRRYAVEHAVN